MIITTKTTTASTIFITIAVSMLALGPLTFNPQQAEAKQAPRQYCYTTGVIIGGVVVDSKDVCGFNSRQACEDSRAETNPDQFVTKCKQKKVVGGGGTSS